MKVLKNMFYGVIIFIVFLVIIGLVNGDTNSQNDTLIDSEEVKTNESVDSKKEEATKEPIDITITAEELLVAYEANELKADQKYKDKEMIIKGEVKTISKVLGSTTVRLGVSGENFEVTNVCCYFNEDQESQVAELEKGTEVIISGICKGLGWDIDIKGCEIL